MKRSQHLIERQALDALSCTVVHDVYIYRYNLFSKFRVTFPFEPIKYFVKGIPKEIYNAVITGFIADVIIDKYGKAMIYPETIHDVHDSELRYIPKCI